MMWCPTFVSIKSFLDPQLTKDGKPYGPFRYKQIIREAYLITKNTNTSYMDVMDMPPQEREYMLGFLDEEARKMQELRDKAVKK